MAPHGNTSRFGAARHSNDRSRSSRRQFLRAGAVTALTVAGVSGTAAAGGGDDGDLDAPEGYPVVTTRDHYDVTWYGDAYRTDGHTAYDYDLDGDWPDTDDELTIFIHGWNNDAESGRDAAYTAEVAMADNDYEQPVVGYVWDSDEGTWWDATWIAEENGPKLANFVTDYLDGHPDTDVRLIAHSLGARVALRAVETLHSWDEPDAITSVALLGGAADNDAVSTEGRYGSDIEAATDEFHNYWKSDDDVLNWAYSAGEFDSAVGEEGCEGPEPDNYTDHNVDDVPDHYSYPQPDEGCIAAVVSHF